MRKFGLVVIFLAMFAFVFSKPLYAQDFNLDNVLKEISGAKESLYRIKDALSQVQYTVNDAIDALNFVEQRLKLLYNFQSSLQNAYNEILNWGNNTLDSIKKEKEKASSCYGCEGKGWGGYTYI